MRCEWCYDEWTTTVRIRWPWPTPHGIYVCRVCLRILEVCIGARDTRKRFE